jgi:hypothetical protein
MVDEKNQIILQLNFERQEEIKLLETKYAKDQTEKHAQILILQKKLNDSEDKCRDLSKQLVDNNEAKVQSNFERQEEIKLLDAKYAKDQTEKHAQILILQKKLNDSENKCRDLNKQLVDNNEAKVQSNFERQEEIKLLDAKYAKDQTEKHAQILILQKKLNDSENKCRDLNKQLVDNNEAKVQSNFERQEEIKLLDAKYAKDQTEKHAQILILQKKLNDSENKCRDLNKQLVDNNEAKVQSNFERQEEIKLLDAKYAKDQTEKHAQILILQKKLNDSEDKCRDLNNKLAVNEEATFQLNIKKEEERNFLNSNFKKETQLKDQQIFVLKKNQEELENKINAQNNQLKSEIKNLQNSNNILEDKLKSTSLEYQNKNKNFETNLSKRKHEQNGIGSSFYEGELGNQIYNTNQRTVIGSGNGDSKLMSSTLYQDLENDSQINSNKFHRKQAHSQSNQKLKLQGNLKKNFNLRN